MNDAKNPACGNHSCAFWNEMQVAEHLNMSVKWLQKMRTEGLGIPYRKFGRNVRYAIADVVAFERASACNSTSEDCRVSDHISASEIDCDPAGTPGTKK